MTEATQERLVMLGTGSAFPRESYQTCFLLRTPGLLWLTDAGGGDGVLRRLADAGVSVDDDLRHLFLTHAHTDHILGAVWMMRKVVNAAHAGRLAAGEFTVYGNAATLGALMQICRLTLLPAHYATLQRALTLHEARAGERLRVGDVNVEWVDCGSENVAQTGYRMTLPSSLTLVCLGDEALTERNRRAAAGADWLLCGAFCRWADREQFRPYEKHHWTVADVARQAALAGVKNLLLYHCEDRTLPEREALYRAEAAGHFTGHVLVPRDGAEIILGRGGW